MKVYVRHHFGGPDLAYDSDIDEVAVVLSDADKFNVVHMAPDAHIYSAFPDDRDRESVARWLREVARVVALRETKKGGEA